ncbi:helix-turn-helix domain-containing protein [Streptomyces sp. NPDC056690]|uniref:helix-turn-helix domain-containing protein n=1 Tax=Streptomyces sp. NPDC056690 TaxID=3345912 RepID=UPI00369D109C
MTPNGIAIRAIRRLRQLRLCDLAHLADLHPSYLSRVERGLAGASKGTIRRLAAALAVSPADITRGADMAEEATPQTEIPAPGTEAGAYFHYTPEQAAQWLPWAPRVLRMKARAYEIPHNRGGGRISFTGLDIREISQLTAVRPLSEQRKRRTKRAAPAAA